MSRRKKRFDERPEIDVPVKTGMLAVFAFAAAVVAVLFMLCVNFVYGSIYPVLAERGPLAVAVGSFLALSVSSLLVGSLYIEFLDKPSPSGIPNLKESYRNENAWFRFKPIFVNFIAGVISLGGGASLGREGPTVFASGATAAVCGKLCGISQQRRRIVCVAGAAAGLAAAFNTPIAAIMFIFEVLADKINGRQVGGLLLAAVIGACTSWAVIGRHPAYIVPELSLLNTADYLLTPIAALAAAVVGIFFQNRALTLRMKARKSSVTPWLRPFVGSMYVWVVGVSVYLISGRLGIFSIGFQDLAAGLDGQITWYVALLLLFGKLTATVLAYSWGCCGGVFAPNLFFGTMAGLVVGGLAEACGVKLGEHGMLLLALVGMSSCLGAVIRAPLTALIIVFEMTGRYEIVPPLMIGTMVSQAYAYYFSDKISLYNAVLRQDSTKGEPFIPVGPHKMI